MRKTTGKSLLQFGVSELAQEEKERFEPAHAYPIWSPYDAHDVADTSLRVLNESKTDDPARNLTSAPFVPNIPSK